MNSTRMGRRSKLSWQVRLRKRLLIPGTYKWNGWVRDFTVWLEKPYIPWYKKKVTYPYVEGDFLIIGPECFRLVEDDSVISYKGENYVPQR